MELNPDTDLVIPHYDNLDVMTIEFFAELALRFGVREVRKFICGTRPEFQPRFCAGASHLIEGAFVWALAFCYAAKHGFRFDSIDSDAYVDAYSKVFSFVFTEYDDFLRNRLSRRELCEYLTRWDSRIDSYYEENYLNEEKRAKFDEDALNFIEEMHKNKRDYPFEGQLGRFFNNLGYIGPHDRYPFWYTVNPGNFRPFDKNDKSEEVKNAAYAYHMTVYDLHRYLYENNIGGEFNIEGLKFLKIDAENHTLELLDCIQDATAEEITAEHKRILDFMTPKEPVKEGEENANV